MKNLERFVDFILNSAPLVVASAAVLAGAHPDPTYNAVLVGASTYLAMIPDVDKKVFIDEFQRERISEEILGSIEFARAAKAALEAAANTASKEKIRKIARLLNSASATGLIQDFDMFKEYAKLVDDISPQEFRILDIMKRNEAAYSSESYQEYQEEVKDLQSSWIQSTAQIKKELNASDRMVESYMLRLTRTGCITPIGITYPGTIGTIYRIAPLYVSLEDYIKQSV